MRNCRAKVQGCKIIYWNLFGNILESYTFVFYKEP